MSSENNSGKNIIARINQAILLLRNSEDTTAEKTLIEIGPSAIEHLINLTKDSDPKIRVKAVKVLGKIQDKNSVNELIQLLNDVNFEVREAAVFSLGALKSEEAVSPLINLINNWKVKATTIDFINKDEDFYHFTFLASYAVHALGEIGGNIALIYLEATSQMRGLIYDVIVAAAKEEVVAIRRRLAGKQDLRDLLYIVKDSGIQEKSPNIWKKVINELAETGDETALPDLVKLLEKTQDKEKTLLIEDSIDKIRERMRIRKE